MLSLFYLTIAPAPKPPSFWGAGVIHYRSMIVIIETLLLLYHALPLPALLLVQPGVIRERVGFGRFVKQADIYETQRAVGINGSHLAARAGFDPLLHAVPTG
jgi:hypothetical protein